ncbi:aldehyde dehydrogenase [Neisseria gonorrhoeae]|nr:aldehyde dehydrogenase [Neisseria gonorrhoeae]
MYINGRFENDFNGEWRDVLNPSTEETIAREPKGGRADVDRGARGADGKHGLEEYLQTQVIYLETDI